MKSPTRPAFLAALLLFGAYAALSAAQDEPLGKSAAFGVLESARTVVVPAGTALRSKPDPKAERLITIATESEIQILEKRGDWVRTSYGDWTGWLAPLGEEDSEIPIPIDLRASEIDLGIEDEVRAAKILSARRLLDGENEDFTRVGSWPLHTDVRNTELLELLHRVAEQVPQLYSERTGLKPLRQRDPAPIILFASEASYRDYAAENTEVGELEGGGHADSSMAALFVDKQSSVTEVASILVHELTHLLNRDSFVQAPSTWLEEGLANDIGFTRIDPNGNLRVGQLGGTTSVMRQRTSTRRVMVSAIRTGGQAMWGELLRNWLNERSSLNPLTRLLDMPWVLFVDPDHRASNYAITAFFVRYLFDEVDPETRAAFLGFIAEAARGGATDGATLARALDTTPEDLERRFERWLTAKALAGR